jgi:hypothetical protein
MRKLLQLLLLRLLLQLLRLLLQLLLLLLLVVALLTFLLRYAPRAWHRPTVVVLLPSPRGVGEMPPTTTAHTMARTLYA